jgi:hypothetical protein
MYVRYLRQGNIGHHTAQVDNTPTVDEREPEPQGDVEVTLPTPVVVPETPEGDQEDMQNADPEGVLEQDWHQDSGGEDGRSGEEDDDDLDERDFGPEDGDDGQD